MKTFKSLIFIFTFIAISGAQTFGQDERLRDFEVWAKLAIEGKPAERIKLGIEQQIRFDENASEVKNYFTELSMNYDLSEQFAVLGRARFLTRNSQDRKNFFRYQLGLRLKHRSGQFRFNHRLLYQRRDEMGKRANEGDIIIKYVRYRFKTEYKIKSWAYDPIITAEFFKGISSDFANPPNAIRLGIGTERSYDKIGTFGIAYRYDWSLNSEFKVGRYILALAYTYAF